VMAPSNEGLGSRARTRRRVVRRPAPLLDATPAAPLTVPEETEPRLLRPAAVCPRCGARPALRVTDVLANLLAEHPADERVGTYQCQRRGCGAIYDLVAAAYQNAA
jgi:hypothetical protein